MEKTSNLATGYLCHCLRITAERFEEILQDEEHPTYPLLKEKYGVGTMCSSCEYEAKGELTEFLLLHPKKARAAEKRPRGLRAELGFAARELRKKVRAIAGSPAPRKRTVAKVYHTGIFFMRRAELESHLVVSNLPFPEHPRNINGAAASLRATLFGQDGKKLGASRPIEVRDGTTLELTPADLFPAVGGDFTGGLYVEYDALAQTGSLRPYGVLVSTTPDARARCHYHDKFALFRDPGFFQNSSPFQPGQTCWMAVANCQPQPYATSVFARAGEETHEAQLSLPAMGAAWLRLADLFPSLRVPPEGFSPATVWFENPQHVMLYFFWFNETFRTWMGQHH